MSQKSSASATNAVDGSARTEGSGAGWRWWFLLIGWMLVIFFLSAQPDFTFSPVALEGEILSLMAHGIEFGVLAGLTWLAVQKTPRLAAYAVTIAIAAAILYGMSDELHQAFVPGRVPDVRDLIADAMGAGLAVLLVTWYSHRRDSRTGGLPRK
ncbi:MAG: VanZ family protein [Chloroflexota bacterium]|nr:VanZ family protein [Chloroflexota bacterium]